MIRICSIAAAMCLVLCVTPLLAQGPRALPPIASVDYDERGVFRVNGKAFFPIALYDAPLDDPTLAELRDFHFNVLACDAKACAALPAKGFYGAVHANHKLDYLRGVFLGIGLDSPALNIKKDLLTKVAEYNAKTRAAVPGRPIMNAIGYWEDEPAGVVMGKLPSKAVYEDLVSAIDVSAPYLYPVPYQPVSSVGDAVARARKASAGKKPLLPVLQLFAWDARDRYPTPAELRCMAFLALVEGAHGIGYYSYGTVTGKPKTTIAAAQPELWQSVKQLNHDIAKVGPRLLAGSDTTDVKLDKADASIRIRAVRDKEAILVVLVNGGPKQQQAKLAGRVMNLRRLGPREDKPFEIKNGSLTVPLPAFGVEILESR